MHKFIIGCALLLLALPLLAQESTPEPIPMPPIYRTDHQPTGNRVVTGSGTFPNVTAQDFPLESSMPAFVVGAASGENILWRVTTATEFLDVIHLTATDEFLVGTRLPTQTTEPVVPVLRLVNDLPQSIRVPQDSSRLTHPVALAATATITPDEARFLHISQDGELLLFAGVEELARLPLNIQPDARIVISGDGRIAVYAEATNQRYVHAIMGDDLEGAALVVLRVENDQFVQEARIDLPGDVVFEGLSPFWADVNQDGVQDLVTTVSDGRVGSRIHVYLSTDAGFTPVDGEAIGQPSRWQHQLAWTNFGPGGKMELVEVRTPHIGGTVRFYHYSEDAGLQIIATLNGYTSHVIGSRNLDMAVAGDFNGDGQPEIVLPSQDRSRIAGIQRNPAGASVIWELPVDGTVVTNLAAVPLDDGLALAVGTADGHLRVWTP